MPSPRRLAFGALGLCGLLYLTAGAAAQTLLNLPFGLWFTEVFIFLGVTWVLIRFSGRLPVAYTRLESPGALPPLTGFGLGVVNYFALVIPLQALALRFSPSWLRNLAPDSSRIFEGQTTLELALVLGAVSVAAPFCEEFFFRGVLQQGLSGPERRPVQAVVITALLFSVFHMDPVGFWARVELGLLFGWLFLRSGSLWTNVLCHAGNNITTTVLYLTLRGSQKNEGQLPLLPVLGMGAVGLCIMFGIWRLAQSHPVLLDAKVPPAPSVDPPPLRPLHRVAAPWLLGAAAALALLVAVDHRGIRLTTLDVLYPLPDESALDARVRSEERALVKLRSEVRRGHSPFKEYSRRRRALYASISPKRKPR